MCRQVVCPTDRREFRRRGERYGGLAGFPGAAGGLAGAEPVGLSAGLEDVRVEGDPVDDRGDQAGVGEDGALLNGRFVPIATAARPSLSVMIWNSSSAPRGSTWT